MWSKTDDARVGRRTALVFAAVFLLFAGSVPTFEARVTDLSALRVLEGEVPYRDFWTMYAPGSFVVLAVAFAAFGRELLVSNVLGIATSAAAVAVYYRLAARAGGPLFALFAAGVVAIAFFGTGYHDGFTSYPPLILFVLMTVDILSRRCTRDGWSWAVVPGALLGAAALFKHDIAAYAALSMTAALLAVRIRARATPVWTPVLTLVLASSALPLIGLTALVSLGAGPDMWRDLIQFPLTDFRHVRPEYFPLIPTLRPTLVDTVQALVHWGICNIPTLALAGGVVLLRRRWRYLDSTTCFVVIGSFVAFWFHWSAAHIQLNTHPISLAAWSLLVAGGGWRVAGVGRSRALTWVGTAALVCWSALFVAQPVYLVVTRSSGPYEWLDLPGLRGIRVPRDTAVWMRELARAVDEAEGPDAPLLFLSNRNDIHVFAESTPFWLTDRRSATRYHELHPGITDTDRVQREMLAAIERGPAPVVVREYRFDDATLDGVKAGFVEHVPVGSRLIDDWLRDHYEPGRRFGPYELMRRCPCESGTAERPEIGR
jgi:hypothetical protein